MFRKIKIDQKNQQSRMTSCISIIKLIETDQKHCEQTEAQSEEGSCHHILIFVNDGYSASRSSNNSSLGRALIPHFLCGMVEVLNIHKVTSMWACWLSLVFFFSRTAHHYHTQSLSSPRHPENHFLPNIKIKVSIYKASQSSYNCLNYCTNYLREHGGGSGYTLSVYWM